MERPDAIAWGLATLFWAAALGALIGVAAVEHRRFVGRSSPIWGRWLAPRVAAGLGFWVLAVVSARWIERRVDAPARASHAPQRASRAKP